MAKDKYTRPEDKRFTLRINGGTFETLQWCAKKHKRSIAKEIEFAIEFYLDDLAMMGRLGDDYDGKWGQADPEEKFLSNEDFKKLLDNSEE